MSDEWLSPSKATAEVITEYEGKGMVDLSIVGQMMDERVSMRLAKWMMHALAKEVAMHRNRKTADCWKCGVDHSTTDMEMLIDVIGLRKGDDKCQLTARERIVALSKTKPASE